MARRTIRCRTGQQRYTVLRIDGDPHDTHAARSFQAALELAMPDRGSRVDVLAVCAGDPSEARLSASRRGQLLRTYRAKR